MPLKATRTIIHHLPFDSIPLLRREQVENAFTRMTQELTPPTAAPLANARSGGGRVPVLPLRLVPAVLALLDFSVTGADVSRCMQAHPENYSEPEASHANTAQPRQPMGKPKLKESFTWGDICQLYEHLRPAQNKLVESYFTFFEEMMRREKYMVARQRDVAVLHDHNMSTAIDEAHPITTQIDDDMNSKVNEGEIPSVSIAALYAVLCRGVEDSQQREALRNPRQKALANVRPPPLQPSSSSAALSNQPPRNALSPSKRRNSANKKVTIAEDHFKGVDSGYQQQYVDEVEVEIDERQLLTEAEFFYMLHRHQLLPHLDGSKSKCKQQEKKSKSKLRHPTSSATHKLTPARTESKATVDTTAAQEQLWQAARITLFEFIRLLMDVPIAPLAAFVA